jgi:hypothetical protein
MTSRIHFRFLSVLALAAAALFTVSCNDASVTEAPAFRAQFDDVVPGSDGKAYTLVSGELKTTTRQASAWIDREGGMVFITGDSVNGKPQMWGVYVPKNAVRRPTLFCVRMVGNFHAQVMLTAHEQDRKGNWINVGKDGFREPVYLLMTYAYATNVVDPSTLTILYDPENGGAFQPTKSFRYLLENNEFVIAELSHFSKYAMAMQ